MKNKDQCQKHHSFLDKTWFAIVMLAVIAGVIIYVWIELPNAMALGLTKADKAGTYLQHLGNDSDAQRKATLEARMTRMDSGRKFSLEQLVDMHPQMETRWSRTINRHF